MLHLIEATRFHLNGELTEHNLWLKQKFERVQAHTLPPSKLCHIQPNQAIYHMNTSDMGYQNVLNPCDRGNTKIQEPLLLFR